MPLDTLAAPAGLRWLNSFADLGPAFYTELGGAGLREEMGLANFLGQAVKENRIRLAYQPVIDSHTGEVAHYEALLRLYGEDGKISSAGALIPIAERMGFHNRLVDPEQLLAEEPGLRERFEAWKAAHPEQLGDADAVLGFIFHAAQRHAEPAWRRYPVLRLDAAAVKAISPPA